MMQRLFQVACAAALTSMVLGRVGCHKDVKVCGGRILTRDPATCKFPDCLQDKSTDEVDLTWGQAPRVSKGGKVKGGSRKPKGKKSKKDKKGRKGKKGKKGEDSDDEEFSFVICAQAMVACDDGSYGPPDPNNKCKCSQNKDSSSSADNSGPRFCIQAVVECEDGSLGSADPDNGCACTKDTGGSNESRETKGKKKKNKKGRKKTRKKGPLLDVPESTSNTAMVGHYLG